VSVEEFFDECICRSENDDLFRSVTIDDWIKGAIDALLEKFSCEMKNANIEILGYPLPCDAEPVAYDCANSFDAAFATNGSDRDISTSDLEGLFTSVYAELQTSTCDYLGRELNGPVNAVEIPSFPGEHTFLARFGRVDGCSILPVPTIFDAIDDKLIQCPGQEALPGDCKVSLLL
jgi:hypothetical protein